MKIRIRKILKDVSNNNVIEQTEIKQAFVTFNTLPESPEAIRGLERRGDNAKFATVAFLICAFKTWKNTDQDTCMQMLKELLNSPSAPDSFNNFTKEFVNDRMKQNDKYRYLADAYFEGSSPQNGYMPRLPLELILSEYPYQPQISTIYGQEISVEKIVVVPKGADTERIVSVYEDPKDRRWYIWSDSYKPLLADIREPER